MKKKLIHKNGKIATIKTGNNFYDVEGEPSLVAAWIIEGDDSWSPVEEYEILSIKYKGDTSEDCVYTRNDEYWNRKEGYVDDYIMQKRIKENAVDILSVKRLSDNEIFSIGDSIRQKGCTDIAKTIKALEISDQYMGNIKVQTNVAGCLGIAQIEKCKKQEEKEQEYSLTLNVKLKPSVWKYWVGEFEKITGHPVEVLPVLLELEKDNKTESPKVLLTTEDGVDIVDPEQIIYEVNTANNYLRFKRKAVATQGTSHKYCKKFSSPEARDVYIENHKPVLCKNDLMPWYDGSSIIMDMHDLHALVGKKLKQQ